MGLAVLFQREECAFRLHLENAAHMCMHDCNLFSPRVAVDKEHPALVHKWRVRIAMDDGRWEGIGFSPGREHGNNTKYSPAVASPLILVSMFDSSENEFADAVLAPDFMPFNGHVNIK